jgi:hypothetical protein
MISEETKVQLAALRLDFSKPLLICDVDEVVVHFVRDFECFVGTYGFVLDVSNHVWGSNLSHASNGDPASNIDSANLVDLYFAMRTLHMEPIDGAIDALLGLSKEADVVMLTNLPHSAGDMRRTNLRKHGLPFPVITNSGPKGPAIRHLSEGRKSPVVFVDDSPGFVQSSWEHAPHVHIVHFLHDERMASGVPALDYVSLRTDNWAQALPHIKGLFSHR